MTAETAAALRAQAAHARRLAENMYNRDAQAELRAIADTLDAQADEIEAIAAVDRPPPADGA